MNSKAQNASKNLIDAVAGVLGSVFAVLHLFIVVAIIRLLLGIPLIHIS